LVALCGRIILKEYIIIGKNVGKILKEMLSEIFMHRG
jgi:hypothetical protein